MSTHLTRAETLALTLESHASSGPDRPALVHGTHTRTYAELKADVSAIVGRFDDLGLGGGDRIALVARTSIAYAQLLYAASWSGVVLVCVNWRLARAEAAVVLEDSEAKVVFADRASADLAGEDRPVVWIDDAEGRPVLGEWARAGRSPASAVPEPDLGDAGVVLQLYTTGTSGVSKGVQLTETNIREMSEQARAAWDMHPGMRFLCALPMFHVSGLTCLITCLDAGGRAVLPAGTGTEQIAQAIEEFGVTHTNFVPTVLASIVNTAAPASYDMTSLEVVIYGSAPAGSSIVAEIMQMLPTTGFSQGYGLTETMAGVAIAPILRLGDADPSPGSVGRILANGEARIVDPATGRDVEPGCDGEIWLRTPQLMVGYWRRPEETAVAVDADGWFRTGDIGCFDEAGHLYIRDRLKDMIISGGENIYSVEVENALATHPAVLESAVYGVPHPRWGETVKAIVVLRTGHRADPAAIMEHLQGRLARYKQPRILEVADELPKTGSGKILKRVLRDAEGAVHA
jgi:long-chain acyl-CoA synthetase